jgi:tetratricopeptide (TPR) repeat protein
MNFRSRYAIGARLAAAVLVAAAALGVAACESDAKKHTRHMASGDAYAEKQQYPEAIIAYRNAIQAQPDSAEAHLKLGRTYLRAGQPDHALTSISRAADIRSGDADLQIEAGALQLLAGDIPGAATRADMVLKHNPKHVPAHILLGNAQAAQRRMEASRTTLERAVKIDPNSADALMALGSLYLATGERGKAETILRRAVEAAPQGEGARVALANYYWMTGDRESAERELRHAIDVAPRSSVAQYALASLYERVGRPEEAETGYKALADQGGTAAKLTLAEYYLRHGKADAAIAAAQPLAGDTARGPEARLLVARAHLVKGRRAEAMNELGAMIQADTRDVPARLLKARVLLDSTAEADHRAALDEAKAAVKYAPDLSESHFVLGLAQLRLRNRAAAEDAFVAAVRINTAHSGAQLELSRLALARGDARLALSSARQAAATHPDRRAAGVQLALALAATGDLAKARETIAETKRRFPKDVAVDFEHGRIALAQKDYGAARESFDRVLQANPDSFEALEGIVAVESSTGKADAAVARLGARIAAAPSDARYRVLAARVEISRNRVDSAIAILRDAIANDARSAEVYLLLGRLYAARGQLAAARSEFQRLAQEKPDAAGPARTMLGIVKQMEGDTAGAAAEYQQALQADSSSAVAANNLAWLYAEQGKLDDALTLAEKATSQVPSSAEFQDTLGWVYYRKGLPMHALPAFEKSAEIAPQNPTYAYHLGLAFAQANQRDAAKRHLQRALEIGRDAEWADHARAQLQELNKPQKSARSK